ncbi:MAG: EamA family transporter [Actinobacteria bacterium]|nr:EamA family transporter [Actinomycetota bacterium]MSX71329.1 EamA family transporter [Actinomycetota bacterium]MSY69021.1 EamA family transporter [Actinomycetota bacterium]MTA75721.1 EamA family transporter [Actinomycetota bacterium]
MKTARLAPYLFVFLWSTGFVGAKYGLPYADPFIFLSLRIFIAAVILIIIARILRFPVVLRRDEIAKSSLIGLFLHAFYLGGVFFAISKGVSAGVAAVITSLQPVFVSLLAVKILGEKLRRTQFIGLVLGLIGVVLVLGPTFDSSVSKVGITAVFVALLGSTTATLMQKKFGAGIPMLAGTAYQYIAAGAVLALAAVTTDGTHIEFTPKFAASMVWLIIALSVGAVLLLLWLLNTGSAASVSSLFYLVPPATALEAYALFGEKVNTQGFLGIGITALGVWLVIRKKN